GRADLVVYYVSTRLHLGSDVTGYLVLAGGDLGGDLVDSLAHRSKTKRHRFELLRIRRRRSRRDSGVRSSRLRRQPPELRVRVRDHLSRLVAVGLPTQGSSNAHTEREDEA